MGKKSRFKKEQKTQQQRLSVLNTLKNNLKSSKSYTKPVYRFFEHKWQAEALCKGKVWISTLETCRNYEDPQQGDPLEASMDLCSGNLCSENSDSEFQDKAKQFGINVEGEGYVYIADCVRRTQLSDAYVLCTSSVYEPCHLEKTFGKHGVKIDNPGQFLLEISADMHLQLGIKNVVAGPIIYKSREYSFDDSPPEPIGFIKPEVPYAIQKEFRFLWIPNNRNTELKPFLLESPNAASFCSLI